MAKDKYLFSKKDGYLYPTSLYNNNNRKEVIIFWGFSSNTVFGRGI